MAKILCQLNAVLFTFIAGLFVLELGVLIWQLSVMNTDVQGHAVCVCVFELSLSVSHLVVFFRTGSWTHCVTCTRP